MCRLENLSHVSNPGHAFVATLILSPVTDRASALHRNIRGFWGQGIWILHVLNLYKLYIWINISLT